MLDDDAAESINWSHARSWLNSSTSREWMDRCVQQIQWDQPQVRVYGRWHRVPRLTAFLADHHVAYRYSGRCIVVKAGQHGFSPCWSR